MCEDRSPVARVLSCPTAKFAYEVKLHQGTSVNLQSLPGEEQTLHLANMKIVVTVMIETICNERNSNDGISRNSLL